MIKIDLSLLKYNDDFGLVCIKPLFEKDKPLFEHVTNGLSVVTEEFWNQKAFEVVFHCHGVEQITIIDESN